MARFAKLYAGFLAVSALLWMVGCSSETRTASTSNARTTGNASADAPGMQSADEAEPTGPPTEGSPEGEVDPGAVQEQVDQAMAAEIQASLASLSEGDREAAIKQKICPISEEPLGSMGTPIKVAVAGHEVFICCEGCEQPLKQDPTTHLAKIGLKPVADAVPE